MIVNIKYVFYLIKKICTVKVFITDVFKKYIIP